MSSVVRQEFQDSRATLGGCMEKKIQIRIMPDGTVESKTINIKGKTCAKYAKVISDLTDARIIDQHYTEEYYEENVAINTEDETTEESQIVMEEIR